MKKYAGIEMFKNELSLKTPVTLTTFFLSTQEGEQHEYELSRKFCGRTARNRTCQRRKETTRIGRSQIHSVVLD